MVETKDHLKVVNRCGIKHGYDTHYKIGCLETNFITSYHIPKHRRKKARHNPKSMPITFGMSLVWVCDRCGSMELNDQFQCDHEETSLCYIDASS